MKRGVLTLAAVAALCALPALADPAAVPADVFLATQGENQFLARDFLLFAKVQNADGQIIGDVEDLILNGDNQIEGVVMGTGGFVGFGEKRIAVRLSALQIKNEDGKVTVVLPQATKEVLDALRALQAHQAAEVAARPCHREGKRVLRQEQRHREGCLREGQRRGRPRAREGEGGGKGRLREGQGRGRPRAGKGEGCRRGRLQGRARRARDQA